MADEKRCQTCGSDDPAIDTYPPHRRPHERIPRREIHSRVRCPDPFHASAPSRSPERTSDGD